MEFNGILVGIASSGRPVNLQWAMSLTCLGNPVGMSIAWGVKVGLDRAKNREEIVDMALKLGAPYIFFLDDDTVCPNFTLRHLHYQLEQNPEAMVCGGIYCTKEDVPSPLVFMEYGGGPFYCWKVNDVFECKGLGTGCMLIKTEIFKMLPKPWFFEKNIDHVDKVVKIGELDVPLMRELGTDDLYFCQKVTEAGFKIIAHGGVLPVHMDENGKMYTLPLESYPCQGANLKELVQS
jgi:hypothetical protein